MNDLISRQAAIKEIERNAYRHTYIDQILDIIKSMPSAHPLDPCETCLHKGKGWDEDPCDGCTGTKRKYEPDNGWIPVSERLPRKGQEVICQCIANIIKVLELDADGDWYQDSEHCYMSDFVIAWMPLPKPYRREKE